MYLVVLPYFLYYIFFFDKKWWYLLFFPGYTVTGSLVGSVYSYLFNNEFIIRLLSIISIPIHFFFFIPFAAIPFLKQSFIKLKSIKNIPSKDIFIGGLAYTGIVFGYLLYFPGNSQLYFLMISIPFIELLAVDYIWSNYSSLNKGFKIFVLITFILGSFTTVFIGLHQGGNGVLKINDVLTKNEMETQPSWNSITKYEYEGMLWLKENTEEEDVIASDRYHLTSPSSEWSTEGSKYFYYSAFSQRQFFLEGWEYGYQDQDGEKNPVIGQKIEICKKLYSNNTNKVEIMNKNEINYLVVSRFSHPDLEIRDKNLDLVFHNRDIKIYSPIFGKYIKN